MDQKQALVVFEGKNIRKVWHANEWWYSIVDVVGILSESADPRNYWKVLKHRLSVEGSEVVTNCNQLKLLSSDGKYYSTDCANTKNLFRIVQSIPSPKAEPFKRWLAKVGYERIQEIQNPELTQKRMKELYKAKGYSEEWIEKRVRGIAVRQELTNEWKKRGVKEEREYAILTNEISKATFGKTVEKYKELKNLKKENLRDHAQKSVISGIPEISIISEDMNDLEIIFTMLGEASTTKIARSRNTLGFGENKLAAKKGGKIAGEARRKLEVESGEKVVSEENYLQETEANKKRRLK